MYLLLYYIIFYYRIDQDEDDKSVTDLDKYMTTAEINEKLEDMYGKNQDLYGKISMLV